MSPATPANATSAAPAKPERPPKSAVQKLDELLGLIRSRPVELRRLGRNKPGSQDLLVRSCAIGLSEVEKIIGETLQGEKL